MIRRRSTPTCKLANSKASITLGVPRAWSCTRYFNHISFDFDFLCSSQVKRENGSSTIIFLSDQKMWAYRLPFRSFRHDEFVFASLSLSLYLSLADVVPRTCSDNISSVSDHLRLHRQYSHIYRRQSTVLSQNSFSSLHLSAVDCWLRCALSAEPANYDQTSSTSDFVRLCGLLSDGRISSPLGLAGVSNQYWALLISIQSVSNAALDKSDEISSFSADPILRFITDFFSLCAPHAYSIRLQ